MACGPHRLRWPRTAPWVIALLCALLCGLHWPGSQAQSRAQVEPAGLSEALSRLQQDWDVVRYQTPAAERRKALERLAARAHQLNERHGPRGDTLVWEGIVLQSLAETRGGLAALPLARQARGLFEAALRLDDPALAGAAYDHLGELYHQSPRWPLGFGNDKHAQALLAKALALDPQGIDPNFHLGQLLMDQGQLREALPCLERAAQAPARPGRLVADIARRQEARALMAQLQGRLGTSAP